MDDAIDFGFFCMLLYVNVVGNFYDGEQIHHIRIVETHHLFIKNKANSMKSPSIIHSFLRPDEFVFNWRSKRLWGVCITVMNVDR